MFVRGGSIGGSGTGRVVPEPERGQNWRGLVHFMVVESMVPLSSRASARCSIAGIFLAEWGDRSRRWLFLSDQRSVPGPGRQSASFVRGSIEQWLIRIGILCVSLRESMQEPEQLPGKKIENRKDRVSFFAFCGVTWNLDRGKPDRADGPFGFITEDCLLDMYVCPATNIAFWKQEAPCVTQRRMAARNGIGESR